MGKIFLGVITGSHGRPSDRGQKYKISLHSLSSDYLQNLTYCYLGATEERIPLAEAPQPSGGKWGQAEAMLLCLPKGVGASRGDAIRIDRNQMPALADNEFLLADFVGVEILDGGKRVVGKIIGCEDPVSRALHRNVSEGINLIIEMPGCATLAIPFGWFNKAQLAEALHSRQLVVADLDLWTHLDTQRDEEDDEP